MSIPALHTYEIELLKAGMQVPVDVYDAKGTLLVRRGSYLNDQVLQMIRKRCFFEFHTRQQWSDEEAVTEASKMNQQEARTASSVGLLLPEASSLISSSSDGDDLRFSATSLRLGMKIAHSVYDERGVLLLAENTVVTPRFLELLQHRGLDSVVIRRRSRATLPPSVRDGATTLTRQLDSLLDSLAVVSGEPESSGWSNRRPLSGGELFEEAQQRAGHYERSVLQFQELAQHLLAGALQSVQDVRDLLHSFVGTIALDASILPHIVAMKTTTGEYLYHHCMNVSLLSMTIAARMGYSQDQTQQIGIAALLHDLGMLSIQDNIRLAPRVLTSSEFADVQYHPIHTLNILEQSPHLDELTMFVAYQVHERCDRSGYPRGRSKTFIHPFAKIISIADTYCAMTSPRPYRDSLLPYHSVEAILGQTRLGCFDAAMIRAFLDCIGLFPIGSEVELSSGQRARVIQPTPGIYDRPTLRLLDEQHNLTDEFLMLRERPDLKVVQVVEASAG